MSPASNAQDAGVIGRYFLNEISIPSKSGRLFLRSSKEETQSQITASTTASTGLQIA
jgi:hypothetical protein